jgi:hypothetical protein
MSLTGGELNALNGKYGISAPYKSVSVMQLIKAHQPQSKAELYDLISFHYQNDCFCGVKSKGTVEDFGKNLYQAQLKEWNTHKYSLQQCILWEYNLFVVQSLKGATLEKKALSALQTRLKGFEVGEAEGFWDEELRIDLVVSRGAELMCAVQVKPITFNFMRQSVIDFNKKANQKWSKPVYYLYYNQDLEFSNLDQLIHEIEGAFLK